jgi:tetratricopeptide (TPR) repeat protein
MNLNKFCRIMIAFVVITGCNKQNEWLDLKANKADVTPATIEHYQALLDASDGSLNMLTPALGMVSADNYYVTTAVLAAAGTTVERNAYTWEADITQGTNMSDWNNPYSAIAVTNIVLDGIVKIGITPNTMHAWNNVTGSALFFRAFGYYQLSQLFMKPYDAATAATDAGLPLRINSDLNASVTRASVEETFQLMINDLLAAEKLLPDQALYQTRPSKQAVYTLLAKIYLNKGDYDKAGLYAAKALQVSEKLIDFNTLSATTTKSMPVFPTHPEVIFYTLTTNFIIMSPASRCIVDTTLLKSYVTNDLRKTLFYTLPNASGQSFFKGQYSATNSSFSGLAVNELLLIQAEAYARKQQTTDALAALNKLLVKRWKSGTFIPVTAATPQDALTKILEERRKELPFTGSTRWEDLRRLNKDPLYARTLTRNVNNQTYQLLPNEARYVLPIPDVEIKLSGIAQNPR